MILSKLTKTKSTTLAFHKKSPLRKKIYNDIFQQLRGIAIWFFKFIMKLI